MKPCQRLLQRLTPFTYHQQSSGYFITHYRTILQYATDTSSTNNSDEKPVRLSTQYPPPSLEERYSKPTNTKSGAKIKPFTELQFKPKGVKTNLPQSGDIPTDLQDENMVDAQAPVPSSPGIYCITIHHNENSVKFILLSIVCCVLPQKNLPHSNH